MKKGAYWPFLVVALLLAGIVPNLVLLVKATADPSFAVEPDYYRKALDWDRTKAQEALNGKLGWSVEILVSPVAALPGIGRIHAAVADRQGRPLEGAAVSVEAFHNARAGQRIESTLREVGPGLYASDQSMRRDGLWEFRVRVARGVEVFTAVVQQDVTGLAP